MSPYKDKEKQKEANKLRMQKVRQGNTTEGNTEKVTQGTRIEFIQRQLNYLVEDIEGAIKVKEDRDIRYERAYVYKLKREGKVKGSVVGLGVKELQVMSANV